MIADLVWAIIWFGIGLVTFQVRGIKSLFTGISAVVSFFSLVSLLFQEPNTISAMITSIGVGYISGIFTTITYLIGANISRYEQFGEMSPKIILYILLLMVWIFLEILF